MGMENSDECEESLGERIQSKKAGRSQLAQTSSGFIAQDSYERGS